jgi:hypothetical protein
LELNEDKHSAMNLNHVGFVVPDIQSSNRGVCNINTCQLGPRDNEANDLGGPFHQRANGDRYDRQGAPSTYCLSRSADRMDEAEALLESLEQERI